MTRQTFKTLFDNGVQVILPYLIAIEGEATINRYIEIMKKILAGIDVEANMNALKCIPMLYWSNSHQQYIPLSELVNINHEMYQSIHGERKEYEVMMRVIKILQKLLRVQELINALRADVSSICGNTNIYGKDLLERLHRMRNNKDTSELMLNFTRHYMLILESAIAQLQVYCSDFYSEYHPEITKLEYHILGKETAIHERMWFLLLRVYNEMPLNIDGIKWETLNETIKYVADSFDTYQQNKKTVDVQLSIDTQTATQNG